MNWRRYLGLERRNQQRHSSSLDVEFYFWDPKNGFPLTDKINGRLINISSTGARLLSNTARVENLHFVMNCGLKEENLLLIEVHSFPESSWHLKSKIVWYNRRDPEEEYKFEFGIEFLEICPLPRIDSLEEQVEIS